MQEKEWGKEDNGKKREAETKHFIKWFFFYANTILFEQQSKATKAKHHEQQQI